MFESISYVMVYVSDMKRSVAFYRDTFGLSLRFESPEWTEFETGQTTLALHGAAPPHEEQYSSREPRAGTCQFGFQVPDLDAAYRRLDAKGVRFAMPPALREEEGIKLAVCVDPDGLPISLAEPLKRA